MNETFGTKIIEVLRELNLSTTEVADALGKNGVIPQCYPIDPTQRETKIGYVRPIFASNSSNYDLHEQIRHVEAGEIPVIFCENCDGRAIIGELISTFLVEKKGAVAVVVNGLVRDLRSLVKAGLPVWCTGVSPIGCYNVPSAPFTTERETELQAKYEGTLAICDEVGVVAIPQSRFNREMVNALYKIHDQEKIWFHCLNVLGWDTKKIVCDKAYLTEEIPVTDDIKPALERLRAL